MTSPMDDLRQASAAASGVQILSPATQAVLDAFRSSHTGPGCLAAALHAAASQLLAVQWNGQTPADSTHQLGINWARDALHILANELETQ